MLPTSTSNHNITNFKGSQSKFHISHTNKSRVLPRGLRLVHSGQPFAHFCCNSGNKHGLHASVGTDEAATSDFTNLSDKKSRSKEAAVTFGGARDTTREKTLQHFKVHEPLFSPHGHAQSNTLCRRNPAADPLEDVRIVSPCWSGVRTTGRKRIRVVQTNLSFSLETRSYCNNNLFNKHFVFYSNSS